METKDTVNIEKSLSGFLDWASGFGSHEDLQDLLRETFGSVMGDHFYAKFEGYAYNIPYRTNFLSVLGTFRDMSKPNRVKLLEKLSEKGLTKF